MPELPEVETVLCALKPHITEDTIISAEVLSPTIRLPLKQDIGKIISSSKIISATRRAKYLLFELSNRITIVIHLGMTGKITIASKPYTPIKHDHVILYLSNKVLIYNDSRRFGLVELIDTNRILSHKFFVNLGPEPLTQDFNVDYLKTKLATRQIPIKTALMDNKILVGVGNIYASEALFLAGISPLRKANDLSFRECFELILAIKTVLTDAINSGRSSIKNFVSIENNQGHYQHNFAVYGKEGEPCRKCNNVVAKIYQSGRSTFFCLKCQN